MGGSLTLVTLAMSCQAMEDAGEHNLKEICLHLTSSLIPHTSAASVSYGSVITISSIGTAGSASPFLNWSW